MNSVAAKHLHTLLLILTSILTFVVSAFGHGNDPSPMAVDHTPVIDTHLHAAYLGYPDADYRDEILATMQRLNIEFAVLHINEAADLKHWVEFAPEKFLAGPIFPCPPQLHRGSLACNWDQGAWPSIPWLRAQYESGLLTVMGELMNVYSGIHPDDERMQPYWALAAELDIPVFIHISRGPPADSDTRPPGCCPNFTAEYGNPALLRPILKRHPELRVVLQHAGIPALPMLGDIGYNPETLELMRDFPNVYVDLTILNSLMPDFMHAAFLQELKQHNLLDRVMFGSDNLPPETILQRYEHMTFLSNAERHAIFADNARRFLRLKDPQPE